MKTLYISDLDGTLLTPDACLSERSTQLLQQLSAEGVFFSCATARSIVSVRRVSQYFAAAVRRRGCNRLLPGSEEIFCGFAGKRKINRKELLHENLIHF